MTTKKSSREMNIVEIESIDKPNETDAAKFQTYNWWLETIIDESWAYYKNAFTAEEIDKIITIGQGPDSTAQDTKRGKNIRSIIRSDVISNQWIFQRLVNVISGVNNQFFNYDLNYIDSLQFVAIDKSQDFTGKYTDLELHSTGTKKISFIVQLSESEDYQGGDVLLHTSENPTTLPRERGTVDIFPAFTLREVTPVTKGTNFVLLGTVIGPRFK